MSGIQAPHPTANLTANFSRHLEILAAMCYILLIIPGVVLYAAVLYVLVVKRSKFKQPFYTTVFSLAAGDLGRAVIYGLLYIVPSLLYGAALGGQPVAEAIFFFQAVMFTGIAGTVSVMSFSRLASAAFSLLNKPTWNTKLFGHRPMLWWLAGFWVHAVGIAVGFGALGCRAVVSDRLIAHTYSCDTERRMTIFRWVSMYGTSMLGIVLLIVNVASVVLLTHRRSKPPTALYEASCSHRSEMSLLAQVLVVYLLLLLNNLMLHLFITFEQRSYAMSFLLRFSIFSCSTVTPAVLIGFNNPLKEEVLAIKCWSRILSSTQAGTSTGEVQQPVLPPDHPTADAPLPLVALSETAAAAPSSTLTSAVPQ